MATPDFFGASATENPAVSTNRLSNLMMMQKSSNQQQQPPQQLKTNNNQHHGVNHPGRDVEPREIPNYYLSPTKNTT